MISATDDLNALLAEGKAASAANEYENAVEIYERAVSLASESWGDECFQIVYPLMSLSRALDRGRVMQNHSDIPKILELQERATATAEKYPAIYELELPGFIAMCGHTLRKAKRYEEARARFEACVALSERVHGDSWKTSHEIFNLGALLIDMQLPGEALPLLERAFEMEQRVRPEKKNWMTPALVGKCLLDLARSDDALPYLEQAVSMRTANRKDLTTPDTTGDELREWIAEARGKSLATE